jgi:signal peptidase I
MEDKKTGTEEYMADKAADNEAGNLQTERTDRADAASDLSMRQGQEDGSSAQGAKHPDDVGSKGTKSAVVEELISWVKSFVIMFVVALFLTQFIIINAVIPSGSMEDTIMTHDRLIGARFSYWFSEPERGDIVIFHYPVDEKRIYIKRIIGLPGETVEIRDGLIYINGSSEPLPEGYLKEEWDIMNTDFHFEVPEDAYLMLGDNRNWSEDARYWADNALDLGLADTEEEAEQYTYVHKDKILGKAIFTYFRKFRILQHGSWYE